MDTLQVDFDSQSAQPHQVVGSEGQGELEVHLGKPRCLSLRNPPTFYPAEGFLDPPSDPLALSVASMTGSAAVDGGTVGVVPIMHNRQPGNHGSLHLDASAES